MLITIDGPAGSGKSTVAKRLARHLGIPYIDTGAMYRTVAFFAIQEGIDLKDVDALVELAKPLEFEFQSKPEGFQIRVSKGDAREPSLLGQEIRAPEISMGASEIAQWAPLRACLVQKQQESGGKSGGVLEGRDAGTVIFPQAEWKFFVTASPEIRAKRRHEELNEKMGPKAPSFEKVLSEVNLRDQQDRGREASPLRPAENAIVIDTSDLAEDEVFDMLLKHIRSGKERERESI